MDRAHVTVVEHPLVQHKLTLMRKVETSTNNFRRPLSELSALLAYEVLRDMPMHEVTIQTPLETMQSGLIDGKKLCLVSILRAGSGILDGFLSVVPGARVGHIGLYRDPETRQALVTAAECLRKEGYDVPDPEAGKGIQINGDIPQDVMNKCFSQVGGK